VCGAEYGQACSERRGRQRPPPPGPGTRWGTIDVAVPKLRTGSYFPDHHSNIRLVGAVPTEQTDERTEVKAAVTSAWRPSNSAVDASEDSVLGTHNCLHSRV